MTVTDSNGKTHNLSDFEGSDRGYLLSKEDTIIERNIDFFYKGKAFNLTIREE